MYTQFKPRQADLEACSRPPRIDHPDSRSLKIGYIPGRDGQPMHESGGCDEGITIGARVRHVERRTSLGGSSVNRQDTAGECGQHVTIHPFTKDCALDFIAPLDEKNSDLQFQD